MKIICAICQDALISSEDVAFIECGHMFHYPCLLQWVERSETCPQCRYHMCKGSIHKAHFAMSNPELITDNVDNLSMKRRIDRQNFQILLYKKNNEHNASMVLVLQEQNAYLREKIRKARSEHCERKSVVYSLKGQIVQLESMYADFKVLKTKLLQKEEEMKKFQSMHKTLSTDALEDLQEVVGEGTDRNALLYCISVMKKKLLMKTKKIENLQNQLELSKDSLKKEQSKRCEIRLALRECEDVSLLRQVNRLEKPLQNCVTNSNSRKNSNENSSISTQRGDIYIQKSTARSPLSSKAEVEITVDANQENSMHNSTFNEGPTVAKRTRLFLLPGNDNDDTKLLGPSRYSVLTGTRRQRSRRRKQENPLIYR